MTPSATRASPCASVSMRSSRARRRTGGWAVGFAAALLAAFPPARLAAQSSSAPTIDTIVIVNHNIFDESEWEELPFIARAADALHIRTHASVIRRALVLNQGDRYDSARVVESERALRSLNVFRAVQV